MQSTGETRQSNSSPPWDSFTCILSLQKEAQHALFFRRGLSMGLGLCFLRGVGALTFPSMAQRRVSRQCPGNGGCDSERGTQGTRWSWDTLVAPAQHGRARPPVPLQNETSPCQHSCLGAAKKHLRSPWRFAVGSSANCLFPPTFPRFSTQTGRRLLEQAKPRAVTNVVLSTWSLFLREGEDRAA